MQHLALSAVTKLERNFVTTKVMDEVFAQGGWVQDVHLFSNIMTNIRFVLAQNRLAPFVEALAGLQIDPLHETPLTEDCSADCDVSLQITFVHSEPDLRRNIPQVPG